MKTTGGNIFSFRAQIIHSHCHWGENSKTVLLVKRLIPFPTVSLWLVCSDLSIKQHVALTLDKTPGSVSEPAYFMFSCCSSSDLLQRLALWAARVESGSPGETSEPAASEGPAAEEVCQGGRACYSAPAQMDLLACALASSWSPAEGLLFPDGSWDGSHHHVFFWGLDAWNII